MSVEFSEAVKLLSERVSAAGMEEVDLKYSYGRILGSDIYAGEDIPSFDRSPYDGYAFRAADTEGASEDHPVTLKVIENIRAGQMPSKEVTGGTAIRLMTGAPLPEGADTICKYEDTDFTDTTVSIKKNYRAGDNIVKAGEDVKKGTQIVGKGCPVDPGIAGALSSLGQLSVTVYKKPLAGIISTGDEVVDPGEKPVPGKIRNSNRYTLEAALSKIGIDSVYLGHADDRVNDIRKLMEEGEERCDLIISTGGVSVGDYDLVPDAMTGYGVEIFLDGVRMKPGMACVYGVKNDKLFLGLSGNPASALTNLQCVCFPALRKLTGLKEYDHRYVNFMADTEIPGSRSVFTRFIRGKTVIRDGEIMFNAPSAQGNVVISSAVCCDTYGILPPGSPAVKSGGRLKGILI